MFEQLTPLENWIVGLDLYTLTRLLFAKLASDVLVVLIVAIPSLVALFRPMRFLWLTTRLRATVLLTASALWVTAWFWVYPVGAAVNAAFRLVDAVRPIQGPEPPPPPTSPLLRPS